MEASPPTNNRHTRPTNVKRGEEVEEEVDNLKCNLDKAQMSIAPPHNNSPHTKEEGDSIPKVGEAEEAVVEEGEARKARTPT